MNESPIKIGAKIRVIALPPYLKTAEPMPMLRPSSIITIGEEGVILDCRPGNYWGIRFNKGSFLLESQYFELIENNHN
jgi:hypothetical protein